MRLRNARHFEPSTLDRFTSMSTRSSISPLRFWSPVALSEVEGHSPTLAPSTSFQPLASNSGFGPDAPHRDTGVQRPDLQPLEPISPLQYALTQKRPCKSFGMRSYKSLDLKSPGMNSYKKHRGVGVVCLLQMLDLTRHLFAPPALLSLCC